MPLEKPLHPETMTGEILMFLAHQDGTWATWGASILGIESFCVENQSNRSIGLLFKNKKW